MPQKGRPELRSFKLEDSVAGSLGPATTEEQPMEQGSVENGNGGRRLINKPVLPFPEPTLTVTEPMEQGSAQNGDGGRRLINKPVLPSPELTLTVTEVGRKDLGDIVKVKEEGEGLDDCGVPSTSLIMT